MPETIFLEESDLTYEKGSELLDKMGIPLVLKAPNSSFSMYVERVSTPDEYMNVGKRFLRRADMIVAQKFIRSQFDWRVGVLAGEPLYICQYVIPKRRWKIMTYTHNGTAIHGDVRGLSVDKASPRLLEIAVKAAAAIGTGLYGVDLKQVDDDFTVIEVNDNPTIGEGEEDQKAPDIYDKLIHYLVGDKG